MYFSPLAMREVVAALGPRTRDALGALLPGPVTLVVANPERLYPLACREDPERLGLRLIGGPLAGAAAAVFQTSANLAGEPAPARFADVDPRIVAAVDLAIDGGELTGLPSTVVDVTGDRGRRGAGDPARGRAQPERGPAAARACSSEVKNSRPSSLPPSAAVAIPTARCSASIPLLLPRAWITNSTITRPSSSPSKLRASSATRIHHVEERLPPPAHPLGPPVDVRLAARPRRVVTISKSSSTSGSTCS